MRHKIQRAPVTYETIVQSTIAGSLFAGWDGEGGVMCGTTAEDQSEFGGATRQRGAERLLLMAPCWVCCRPATDESADSSPTGMQCYRQ